MAPIEVLEYCDDIMYVKIYWCFNKTFQHYTRAETNIQIVWVFARLWQYSNPHWIFEFKTFDIMQVYACAFAIFINAHCLWHDTYFYGETAEYCLEVF